MPKNPAGSSPAQGSAGFFKTRRGEGPRQLPIDFPMTSYFLSKNAFASSPASGLMNLSIAKTFIRHHQLHY
jgi:hypothetical protein